MTIQADAASLARGAQIAYNSTHHSGMAELLSQLGRPRPEGRTKSGKRPLYTLSLVNPDSPSCYQGYVWRKGGRKPYRLSTDPDDYAWETYSENAMRKPEEIRSYGGLALNLLPGAHEAAVSWGKLTARASQITSGKTGRHVRWHVNRGIVNPDCELCT